MGSEMKVLAANYGQFNCLFTDLPELDICNETAVRRFVAEKHVNCIVNCAAFTAVDKAEDEVELCDQLNHWAPGFLARVARENGASFVHISTDYIFDGRHYLPYTEEDAPCPNSIYGRTKLEGERFVRQECPQALIIRTSWLYSSFGHNFVKTMIAKGREKESMGVVFDQIGTPTYARDLAGAIFAALSHGLVPGTYHFSNEGVCSWYDFARSIHKLAGITTCRLSPLHTGEYPARAPRPAYSVLDKTKIKQTYQIEIPHWEESLERCIKLLEQ